MQTLQERIEELMAATGWSVGKIASVAGVSSSAVSQWLGRGGMKSSKSIGNFEVALRLEEASGFSAMWLAKGKGLKMAPPDQLGRPKDNALQSVDEGSVLDIGADQSQYIPTSMKYESRHLKSAILLMGSLLGALDARSRSIIGDLLKDLSSHTDDAHDIAEKASALATVQKPVTNNKALNKAIRGRGDPVETSPAPLEHK